MNELLPYLPILNLLLVPAFLYWRRLDRMAVEWPVVKQRVARLEKSAFGIEGLPADQT